MRELEYLYNNREYKYGENKSNVPNLLTVIGVIQRARHVMCRKCTTQLYVV